MRELSLSEGIWIPSGGAVDFWPSGLQRRGRLSSSRGAGLKTWQGKQIEAMEEDDFMDATLQVHAFGLSAGEDLAPKSVQRLYLGCGGWWVRALTGCTLCLDNVPNQLAVLGHFRAMLEMCGVAANERRNVDSLWCRGQNQIEGDPEQLDCMSSQLNVRAVCRRAPERWRISCAR